MKFQTKTLLTLAAGMLLGASILAFFSFDKGDPGNDLIEKKADGKLQYKWYAPDLPKTISFAGEPTPLNRWEVRERLDRDILINYYAHGSLLYILKLSSRYFPVIEQRLKANGIPDDFKYLCVAESSLQHLTSAAGAQSFWQFLSATGQQYGLIINDEVDQRYDVAKATDAACKYFQAAYNKFGSWTAAAASYNCGMGGYNSQATFQGSKNYYDLIFPEETNRYIFRILALKYLISNAHNMGYIIQAGDAYAPFNTRTITVTSSIPNLNDWVQANGSSYKMLKILNPWLRARTLTLSSRDTFQIALPE
ncbi:MAG: lytic transglycosylase domain-containing protein [Chitinophagaceae bacterium]